MSTASCRPTPYQQQADPLIRQAVTWIHPVARDAVTQRSIHWLGRRSLGQRRPLQARFAQRCTQRHKPSLFIGQRPPHPSITSATFPGGNRKLRGTEIELLARTCTNIEHVNQAHALWRLPGLSKKGTGALRLLAVQYCIRNNLPISA